MQDLDAETQAAWDDYLEATRDKQGQSYADVEPWAWARLQQWLRRIKKERGKVPA